MGHKNYEISDFGRNSANKMAASRTSWIRSVSNCAHLRIHPMIVYKYPVHYDINYDHGSQKLWKCWFLAKFSKKNGRQSAIFDPIHLKFCTLVDSMLVYKFPIHYVYKLWSWVTQIMNVLIFSQIKQTKWQPVGHLGSDPSQILHTDTFDDCLQVSCSLCI